MFTVYSTSGIWSVHECDVPCKHADTNLGGTEGNSVAIYTK